MGWALALGACHVVNLPSGYGAPVFTPEWQARYKGVPERAMNCQIEIYRVLDAEYDPDTDTWSDSEVIDYTGKARVQPLRSTRWITPDGNDAPVMTVLFSIPVDTAPTLYVSQQVRVTVSPLNPDLLRYPFVVGEIMDSGNIIERTFLCTVNQESI